MSDWSKSAEDAQADDFAPKLKPPSTHATAAVLPVLQNWQVLDVVDAAMLESDGNAIEGEATVVDTVARAVTTAGNDSAAERLIDQTTATAGDPQRASFATIPDQVDPTIIVTLAERHCQVVPGEEAHYALTILNNGAAMATFQPVVEGWIAEAWLTTPLPKLALERGARQTITVTIRPPRLAQTLAGERALAFVIRRDDDAERVTRLGATLTILPYTELHVGPVQPDTAALTWRYKKATIPISVTNRSNHAVAVRLQVDQPHHGYACTIEMPLSKAATGLPTDTTRRNRSVAIIPPDKTIKPNLKIAAHRHPFISLHRVTTPLQISTSTIAHTDSPYQPWTRTVVIPVTTKPLIGPWQLTSLVGLLAITMAGMGVAGLVALLLFSLNMRHLEPVVQPASQALVAPAPVIVAYIQAPVPHSANQGTAPLVAPATVRTPIVVQARGDQLALIQSQAAPPAAAGEAVPILSVDQVSAPNHVLPVSNGNQPLMPAELNGAPATPAPMTYATMFHEIAGRYDLNWRVLAAQAYVESGFDSVALGAQGDLGLMQVHPTTWREWAPKVDASDPFDSYSNVLVAAAYLDYLRTTLSKRGHPELEWALVAYNWGIDKVLQHLESGQGWQELAPIRQGYATEILRLAATISAAE